MAEQTLWIVKLDDGNMSHPYDVALVKAETEDDATKEALGALSEEGEEAEDFHEILVEQYEGALRLAEGHTVEWLNQD